MSKKKTPFRKEWKANPIFSPWIQEVPNDMFSAKCLMCNSIFYLSNMGKQALTSHMKSKKHQNATKSQHMSHSLKSSFEINRNATNPSVTKELEPVLSVEMMSVSDKGPKADLPSFLSGINVARAEILWSLYTVAQHASFNSSSKSVKLFSLMFPDSDIAKKMSLQRTKLSYTVVHGLAPYFSSNLVNTLKDCSDIVVGFDESLNKVAQKQQMDISVRFWHHEKDQVSTRYLTSEFLGHSCAKDLVDCFKNALSPVGIEKLVQVSMDGPNVNLKFLKDLNEELCISPTQPGLLDLGTCGLHTMNNAFKLAIKETGWKIVQYLRASYYLFKDVPARRADYIHYTGSTLFPKKFCYIRWIENSAVTERALLILPQMIKFVQCAVEDKKKYCSSNNFKVVADCLNEKMFGPQLAFFQSLASHIEPFLINFQSDEPLAPFLYEELTTIVQSVLQKFVKQCVLKSNALHICKIDVFQKDNLIPASEVALSFAVKDELRKIKKKTTGDILKFRQSCLKAYQSFVCKLFERSPLAFPLTKAISFLDPTVFLQTDLASARLSVCLQILVSKNRISGLRADNIHQEFQKLLNETSLISVMKSYKRKDTRLDNHWSNLLNTYQASNNLNSFVKMILIFSHGNSFLERGFSINSDCVIENQTEESLVALRQVYGAINDAGGLEKVDITKAMIHSVKLAHSRYTETNARKKEEENTKKQSENNRKRVANELKSLEHKKVMIMAAAQKEAALIEEEIKNLRK